MKDNTYLKNFIKFLTFGYYYLTKLKRSDYSKYIIIEYSTALHNTELGFLNRCLKYKLDTFYLRVNYNKFDIAPLNLTTFTKKKKEILSKTKHVYLLSLKQENLIPYTEYKIKKLALSNLFSTDYKSDTVYVIKLIDLCKSVADYFVTLKEYYVNRNIDGFQMMNILDSIFEIADHYFNLFTNSHFVLDYIFYKENKLFKKYPVIYSDEQFDATMNLIKERLTKTITIDGAIRKLENLFTQKYNKTFDSILCELNLHQDYEILSGNYTFKNMRKINLQDFVLYLIILRNQLLI